MRKLCKDPTIETADYEDAAAERAIAILITYSPRNAYFSEVFSNTNNIDTKDPLFNRISEFAGR